MVDGAPEVSMVVTGMVFTFALVTFEISLPVSVRVSMDWVALSEHPLGPGTATGPTVYFANCGQSVKDCWPGTTPTFIVDQWLGDDVPGGAQGDGLMV